MNPNTATNGGQYLGDLMHDVLSLFFKDIDKAITAAQPFVMDLMWGLLGLELVMFGLETAWGKHASLGQLLERLIMVGAIVLIVKNFATYVTDFANSMSQILALTAPQGLNFVNSPGAIFTWGQNLIITNYDNAVNNVLSHAGFFGKVLAQLDLNPQIIALSLKEAIIGLGFDAALSILAVQMALAQIMFHLSILFALILLPFVAWAPVRFLGMRAFGAVIGEAIRMGIVTFVITLGCNIINTLGTNAFNSVVTNPTPETIVSGNVFGLLMALSLLVFLAWQAPALAMSLLSGTPALGASAYAQNMGAGLVMSSIAGGLRGLTRGTFTSRDSGGSQTTVSQSSGPQGTTPRSSTTVQSAPAGAQYQPTQISAASSPATPPSYARAPGYAGAQGAGKSSLPPPPPEPPRAATPAAAALQPQYLRRTT